MCQVFSHTWRLAYSILGKMMKARGKFAEPIAHVKAVAPDFYVT